MKIHAGSWLSHAFFVLASVGCGSTSESAPSDHGVLTLGSRLQRLERDFGLGATGDDVATVHAYLRQYGYLPNPELALKFPSLRPAVSTAPADDQRFDEYSEAAVKAFQSFFKLGVTGAVDEATRGALKTLRCEQPDVATTNVDPSEKFALIGVKFNKTALTWKLENTDDGISLANARIAITNALDQWAQSTNLTFTNQASGQTDLTFNFGTFCNPPSNPANCCDGGGCPSAFTSRGFSGTTITSATTKLYSEQLWSVSGSTPAGRIDLWSTALHEAGHALGVTHSSVTSPSTAVMYPDRLEGTQRRSLTPDDHVAIGVLYDQWTQIAGAAARDIATGADGSVWIVSNTPSGANDFTIQKLVGSTFQTVSGIAGVRVGVDNLSRPWVLTSAGTIRLRSGSGYWGTRPGCAKDLAVGGGEWWIISCDSDGAFDYNVKAWNGTGWTATDGWGVAISAGPDGIPWVVEGNGNVWRKQVVDPATPGWEPLPIYAQDIGVDPVTGNVWFLDDNSGFGNDYTVGVWSEQVKVLDRLGRELAPRQFEGVLTTGGAARIAALNSDPWIVKSDWGGRGVWHRAR